MLGRFKQGWSEAFIVGLSIHMPHFYVCSPCLRFVKLLILLTLLPLSFLLWAEAGYTQRCSSFRICEEAIRSLQSGNRSIDGDGDGIPCETLCGTSKSSPPQQPAGRDSSTWRPPGLDNPVGLPATHGRPPERTPAVSGPVTLISVGDGDTIRVRIANGKPVTIRLACIDAPETAQGQVGADATTALTGLVAVGSLEIKPQNVDRYGRTVAEVYAGGRNVNLALVRSGAAFVYRQYLHGCNQNAYLEAESQAQRSRQGIWRRGNIQPPWEFRQQRKDSR